MTIIFENFTDIVGKAVGGYVKIRSVDIRPGVKRSGMVTNHTIVVDLVDGHFRSPELDPGPTVITLRAGYVRKSWTLNIPLEGEHELWPLVVASNEYTPEVVGQAQSAATAAAKSASSAEASARATSADRAFVATARAEVEQTVSDGAAAVRALLEDDIAATGEARDATEAAREEVMDVAVIVESAITSTRWDADRLTVMGKQSQPLTGPRGARGESGPPGVPETPWVDVPLDSGVSGSVKVRRVGGVVSIRLEAVTGAAGRIATLPGGYAPPADARVETYLDGSSSEVASITVHASGEIHAGPRFTPQWAEVDAAWVRDGSGMFFTDQELPPEAVVPEFSSSLRQVEEHMQRAESARDGAVTARTAAEGARDDAVAASASATDAATGAEASESAAGASATAAKASETAAAGSATAAKASETAAKASETAAGVSATAAAEDAGRAESAASTVDSVMSEAAGLLADSIADDLAASKDARTGAESARDQAVGAAGEASMSAAQAATSAADAEGAANGAGGASTTASAKAGEAAASATSASESAQSAHAAKAAAETIARDEAATVATSVARAEVASLVGAAPGHLDTLEELATFASGNASSISAITSQMAGKVNGNFTLVVSSTPPSGGTPNNQITFVV